MAQYHAFDAIPRPPTSKSQPAPIQCFRPSSPRPHPARDPTPALDTVGRLPVVCGAEAQYRRLVGSVTCRLLCRCRPPLLSTSNSSKTVRDWFVGPVRGYALCATGIEHILPPRAVWLPRLDVLTGTPTHPVGRQQAALRIADAYRTATGWKMNNELHLLPATMAAAGA